MRKRRLGRAPKAKRSWRQWLVVVIGCVTVLALGTSAAALAWIYGKYERLGRVELTDVLAGGEAAQAGEPQNYLIVGVDNAAGLASDDPVRRGRDNLSRSDTIMILRIDPQSRRAALLSLPRDLWVPIAGTGSSQRINSAIEQGGPSLLIRTIHDYLGIPVHHYIQIDFAAFRSLVETIGGVTIYVPRPARDRNTGLDLARGCVTLDPDQALAYVRSRHYEEHVGNRWVEDSRSDLGRIQRQQEFIRRALSRAIDKGARNPAKLDRLIEAGLDGITVDDALTADDLFTLGNRFRSFEPNDLIGYAVPTENDTVGEAQILRLLEDQAEPVLAIFRGGGGGDSRGGDISPESVRLQVLNGSGRPGEGSAAAGELADAGFNVSSVGDADTFDNPVTVVRYPAGQRDQADLVARWLVAGARLVEDDTGGLTVVTGRDWEGLRSQPRQPASGSPDRGGSSATTSSLPSPSDLSTTTTTASGGTSSSTTTSTNPAGSAAARNC